MTPQSPASPAGPGPGVALPRHLARRILAQARREAPQECCGLLIGEPRRVCRIFPAHNELASPTRYRIDSRDHLLALRRARELGLLVIGAYHSHPRSAPVPSPTDRDQAWMEFLYLIASLDADHADGAIRGWQFNGRNFVEVSLVTPD